jgi:putative heme iron utilization protein
MDGDAPNESSGKAPRSVIRPTDEAALNLASRVLTGTDIDGVPVILTSTLATHTKALLADPRCALLFGEPGRGDPLAWPRITIRCTAEMAEHDSESDSRLRTRFLRRHPKAKLYASFRDFAFFRLVPKSASLNGGFGRAYNISGGDFVIDSALNIHLCSHELQIIEEIEKSGCNVAGDLAKWYFQEKTANWHISGVDAEGLDIARKEKVHRLDFRRRAADLSGLIAEYSHVLNGSEKN